MSFILSVCCLSLLPSLDSAKHTLNRVVQHLTAVVTMHSRGELLPYTPLLLVEVKQYLTFFFSSFFPFTFVLLPLSLNDTQKCIILQHLLFLYSCGFCTSKQPRENPQLTLSEVSKLIIRLKIAKICIMCIDNAQTNMNLSVRA